MKTKNLAITFILFLLLTLASGLIVFLTEEKQPPILKDDPGLAEKQTEPVAEKPEKATTTAPKKNKIPPTPFVKGGNNVVVPAEEKIKAAILINGIKYETAIKPGSSVYDMMNLLKAESKVNFSGKDYASLGFFIEEINGVKNNPVGENWLYYVNGKSAQVGISYYVIKAGDIIEWKYSPR